jgi:hypothetical protein
MSESIVSGDEGINFRIRDIDHTISRDALVGEVRSLISIIVFVPELTQIFDRMCAGSEQRRAVMRGNGYATGFVVCHSEEGGVRMRIDALHDHVYDIVEFDDFVQVCDRIMRVMFKCISKQLSILDIHFASVTRASTARFLSTDIIKVFFGFNHLQQLPASRPVPAVVIICRPAMVFVFDC